MSRCGTWRRSGAAGLVLLLAVAGRAAAAQEVRLYGGLDYLNWQVKGAPLSVPLVSTGPAANYNGFLLGQDTTILYGAPRAPGSGGRDRQEFNFFSGGRLTLGYALGGGLAVEASGFGLESRSAGYHAQGNGGITGAGSGIRVPVYNAVPYFIGVPVDAVQSENGLPVALPGIIGGQVRISNRLSLWGADASVVHELYRAPNWSLSGVGGLRYLDLTEDFDLADSFFGIGGPFVGKSGTVRDHFGTSNRFVGATIGLRGTASWGPFSLAATGRLGLGATLQELNVAGSYDAINWTTPAGAQGIFAQPANSGRRTGAAFAVDPEFQVKLGYDVTPSLRLTIGYDVLYLSSVVRPGDQIDRNIPKGQVFKQAGVSLPASTTVPGKLFRTTDFYAQGLSAGVSFRF